MGGAVAVLNAVQQHLAHGILDGVASGQLPPLVAVVQPPVWADVASEPYAFVWAGTGSERRQTAPRTRVMGAGNLNLTAGGYQVLTWSIEVALAVVMAQDDPNIETAFPGLIDAVLRALNVTQMPITVPDPITGQDSQILTIAESVDSDYAAVRVTGAGGQSLVRFACNLMVEVKEKVAWSEGVAS